MKLITELTQDSKQKFSLIGELNQRIDVEFYYLPTQQGWFFNLSYDGLIINGAQLVAHPNILKSYENILNFGIACISETGLDPTFIDDFVEGRINIYLLNEEEKNSIEELIIL